MNTQYKVNENELNQVYGGTGWVGYTGKAPTGYGENKKNAAKASAFGSPWGEGWGEHSYWDETGMSRG